MADRKFNQKRDDANEARGKGKVTRAVGTTRGPGMNSQPPSLGLGRSSISNASFEQYPMLEGNRKSYDGSEWHVPASQHDDIRKMREQYGTRRDYNSPPPKPGFNQRRPTDAGKGRIVTPQSNQRGSISYVNNYVNSKYAPGTSQMLVADTWALGDNKRPVVVGNRTAGPASAKAIGDARKFERESNAAIAKEKRFGPLNKADQQTATHLRSRAKGYVTDANNQADDYVNSYQAKQASRMRGMMDARKPKPDLKKFDGPAPDSRHLDEPDRSSVPEGMRIVDSRGRSATSAAINMDKYKRSRGDIHNNGDSFRDMAGTFGAGLLVPAAAGLKALYDDRRQQTHDNNVNRRRDDASDMGPVKGRALERSNQFEGGRPKTAAELNQEKDVATMKKNGTPLTKAMLRDAKK